MARISEFKIITLELPDNVSYQEDEFMKRLKAVLGDHDLRDQLYSFFNMDKIGEIKRTGSYRGKKDSIFAFTEDQLIWDDGSFNCLSQFMRQYSMPALAIYDKSSFIKPYLAGKFEYRFINSDNKKDSLIAIIEMKEKI